jgi:hypothetical protein
MSATIEQSIANLIQTLQRMRCCAYGVQYPPSQTLTCLERLQTEVRPTLEVLERKARGEEIKEWAYLRAGSWSGLLLQLVEEVVSAYRNDPGPGVTEAQKNLLTAGYLDDVQNGCMYELTQYGDALPHTDILPCVESKAHAQPGMPWQEAAERMERLQKQGAAFTSQQQLANDFHCGVATISKAIKRTPSLQDWAQKPGGSPKSQSINAVVTDCTAQSRELNPEDDAAVREFIELADPEVKAWFLALSPEDQLAYVNDPDKHQTILGRKP